MDQEENHAKAKARVQTEYWDFGALLKRLIAVLVLSDWRVMK